MDERDSSELIDRILGRAPATGAPATHRAASPEDAALEQVDSAVEEQGAAQLERDERDALRRVGGLSTELEDVTEVEYRQVRLERVVLIGVYAGRSAQDSLDAENSLRELAALTETAGAVVLDGLLQRRPHPDPSTYLGKGKAQELKQIVGRY